MTPNAWMRWWSPRSLTWTARLGVGWLWLALPLSVACGSESSGGGASGGAAGSTSAGSSAGGSAASASGGNGNGGAASSGGSGGGSAGSGGGGAGGAVSPCRGAPEPSFDPLAAFQAPGLNPDVVVANTADSGDGSLREAIATADQGAVIAFDSSLTGATIRLASPLQLSQSVTLDGTAALGITIDADQQGNAIKFSADGPRRFAFYGLRFINGRTDGTGGAISLNGGELDVEIAGCAFADNAAGEGGALRVGYAKQSNVLVRDSVFTNNDGTLKNSGFSGGAISAIGTNLRVIRSRFEGNVGSTTGALYTIHSDPVVEDSVFIDNRADGDAGSGAFFADGGGPGDYNNPGTAPGQITLLRSLFQGNRGAGDDGGAGELYAYPQDAVRVEDCVFFENRAEPGRAGALFIHADKTVDIVRTAFVQNQASRPGGAIWADGKAQYTIDNSLFDGNVSAGDLGGALRLNIAEAAKLVVSNCTLVDNVASDGNGALWLPGMRDVTFVNSLLVGNTAHPWSQQINFAVSDAGGNLIWPDPQTNQPTLAQALVADPDLQARQAEAGTWVRALGAASPAIGAAVATLPTVDQRGYTRDASPDSGSYEVGAACGGQE